jgi:hypothetical protein
MIMESNVSPLSISLWRLILLAGLAGGVAEIVWIAGYGTLAPVDTVEVARQVGVSLIPAARDWPVLPAIGVVLHLALSLLLAAAYVLALWRPFVRRAGRIGTFVSAVGLVLVVWAANFLVVLPRLNPEFVTLLPVTVTLLSKTLFGLAMAATVQRRAPRLAGDAA